MLYQFYGIVVETDKPIPGIPPSTRLNVDLQVRYAYPKSPSIHYPNFFIHWFLPGGELWLSVAKMDEGYLLRFNGLGDFYISSSIKEIVIMPRPGIPLETIQHLLLDQVIPLIINLKGGEVLHASAVLTPQGLIAFIGPTGSGKSTTAGIFLQDGNALLTDDCLALIEKDGNIYGVPAYPGLRLWDDAMKYLFKNNGTYESVAHYTQKLKMNIERELGRYCSEPMVLRRLYDIADSSEVKKKGDIMIERISLRDSFMTLIRCAFRLDITDRNMLTHQFHFLERVASKISVRRLIFPRNFDILPSVRETILSDLKDLDN